MSRTVTKVEQPTSHTAVGRARTTFHIKDSNVTNLRLIDVGLYNTTADMSEKGYYYNHIGGVESLIRSMKLEGPNGTVLSEFNKDSIIRVTEKNLLKSNQKGEDLDRFRHLQSYSFRPSDTVYTINTTTGNYDYTASAGANSAVARLSAQPQGEQYTNFYANATPNTYQTPLNSFVISGQDSDDSIAGQVDLSKYLGVLQQLPEIGGLGELRLTIFWETDIAKTVARDANGADVTANWGVKQPRLAYEQLIAVEPKEDTTVAFFEEISDVFPMNAALGLQKQRLKPSTFDGHYLEDLTIMVRKNGAALATPAIPGEATMVSLPQLKTQISVNHRNVLPESGSDSPGQHVMHRLRCKGDQLTPYVSYLPHNLRYDASGSVLSADVLNLRSQMAPMTYKIGQRVKDLQIDLDWNNGAAARNGHEIVLVGRVAKALSGNSKNVSIDFV